MPLPESFDINSFGSADLWGLTRGLARKLPRLHVAQLTSPNHQYYAAVVPHVRATLHTPVVNGQRVEFGDTTYRGPLDTLQEVYSRACQAMGKPATYDQFTQDHAPTKGADAELQLAVARKFLSYLGKVSIVRFTYQTAAEEEPRAVRGATLYEVNDQEDRPSQQTVEAHAKINLHLASLTGEETKPYEEIVAQAATWDPANNLPPALNWLRSLGATS